MMLIAIMLGGFVVSYAIVNLLPGWRSMLAAAVTTVVTFVLFCLIEGDGIGSALAFGLFAPAWVGAVGGVVVRSTTLPRMIAHDRRLLTTLPAAPAVAVIGFFASNALYYLL